MLVVLKKIFFRKFDLYCFVFGKFYFSLFTYFSSLPPVSPIWYIFHTVLCFHVVLFITYLSAILSINFLIIYTKMLSHFQRRISSITSVKKVQANVFWDIGWENMIESNLGHENQPTHKLTMDIVNVNMKTQSHCELDAFTERRHFYVINIDISVKVTITGVVPWFKIWPV